ncbi:1,2-phenylacetyl-CoA epoxidase subunit PaaC [Aneurinibacillus thermoaerophilus]|uniref:1,2-phenylacetyl-CoA epoxidase subunit PaaC n=1 Tax=Aneurinibacillus thermoaerophilus TaxID=143495 RepID=UPI002E1FE90C|nr:1,2-phenylacetyl-CoA epoxidase subunit PaaC [Aneurinibacillus thermoaerophilus]MED0738150.1 phenylacetate-CoA oxygenase subunit PaaC [Aneurinibacillus thermoaerophilus]
MANQHSITSADEAKQHPEYLAALKELLYQMADDDFILAYRGSEWLGLGPHIEEDVAFSSISQDTMGHAVMFYEMLEELGEGKADDLAQLREASAFRNAILVERPNGTGHYKENPHFDWGYAVTRFYLYGLFKQTRLESLVHSSYQPLTLAARKMLPELGYHLYHWQVWMNQLAVGSQEGYDRIMQGVEKVWQDAGDLFVFGSKEVDMIKFGLIESGQTLAQRWLEKAKQALDACVLPWPGMPQTTELSGRAGQHTPDLTEVLNTLSEVYRIDPAANW